MPLSLGLRASYERVFKSTPDGRRVLADLERRFDALPWATTYTEGDHVDSAHREGGRRVLAFIHAQLRLTNRDIHDLQETHDGKDDR